ncbi:LysM peptidoglycan-binding domain-containing protein [Akkermansiaceae bacterium]|nr:LysM peptidoglycan-binding domain-containing protein [Akkermansiaceae bacterium]|tara:strand:- start:4370 stop:5248 length:879 start_codon:yes stop_codon:yes gene_type:complete
MKLNPELQKKRKAPKGPGLRILNASTGNHKRRKQRAATATGDDFGEVPGVGVARALVVILLLHVVAIGGIAWHSKWSKENVLKATPSAATKPSESEKPKLVPGGKHGFVERGDNYLIIAGKHGVDVEALKLANNSAALSPGLRINIPPRRVEASTPSELAIGDQTPAVSIPPVSLLERPLIQSGPNETQQGSRSGPLVAVESTLPSRPAPESEPVLIKPRIRHLETPTPKVAPRAIPVDEPLSGKTYLVVKGDSIWGLSKKFGVSEESLMSINGISDPTKLRLGVTLKIPVR